LLRVPYAASAEASRSGRAENYDLVDILDEALRVVEDCDGLSRPASTTDRAAEPFDPDHGESGGKSRNRVSEKPRQ